MWPNWYWVWSMSSEPSSFSVAFLLSMKVSSGMAPGFRMRYLSRRGRVGEEVLGGEQRTGEAGLLEARVEAPRNKLVSDT